MRRTLLSVGLAVACQWVFLSPAYSQTTDAITNDPILGTWDLNVPRSKFTGPAPKSETRTYVIAGNEIKATRKAVHAAGKESSGEWTIGYDGKDRPQIGTPDTSSVSFKRINPYNVEFTEKSAGKVVRTGTRVISKDGKTMTISSKDTNAKGQPGEMLVFVKR